MISTSYFDREFNIAYLNSRRSFLSSYIRWAIEILFLATIKSTFPAESLAIVVTKMPGNYRHAIASISGNEKSNACKLAVRICETRSSSTTEPRRFGSLWSFENSLPRVCTRGKFVSQARNRESEFTFLRDSIIVERRDYRLRSLAKILRARKRFCVCWSERKSIPSSLFTILLWML